MKYKCILVQYLDSLVLMIGTPVLAVTRCYLLMQDERNGRPSRVSQVKFGVYKRCNRNEQLEKRRIS